MRKRYLHFSIIFLILIFSAEGLFAGAWTLRKGRLWVKSAFLIQRTSERYASETIFCGDQLCRNGQRTPYFFNGRVESNATYLDIWYGLTDRFELQLQLPYFDIAFEDEVNPNRPSSQGLGDVRFGLRYRIPFKPIVTTFRIGAKAPTGFFNKDSEVVPIGEGQWDLEVSADFGRSFWPLPAYTNLSVGYRFRFEPDLQTTNLDPGDEFWFRAETGIKVGSTFEIKTLLEGFWGQEFTALFADSNLRINNSERRILYFRPGIGWMIFEPLEFEFSTLFSLSGKNYPAGNIYILGLAYTFDF